MDTTYVITRDWTPTSYDGDRKITYSRTAARVENGRKINITESYDLICEDCTRASRLFFDGDYHDD